MSELFTNYEQRINTKDEIRERIKKDEKQILLLVFLILYLNYYNLLKSTLSKLAISTIAW